MSLQGKINSLSGDFASAIQEVSRKGRTDFQGADYGTRKTIGYVCNVHGFDDEDEELRGTVDVQEYDLGDEDDKVEGVGHHQGVLCSAINDNKNGIYLMPTMYSDVVIAEDPVTMEEYVVMYSHVDIIQLQSHETIKMGVVETEPFVESYGEDDDTPDYNELEETGNSSISEYDKGHIKHTVQSKDGKSSTIEQKADEIDINGGKNGGLINIEALTNKLNALENDLNDLKTGFKAWEVTPQDGGAKLYFAVTEWMNKKLDVTSQSDYEDTSVKH